MRKDMKVEYGESFLRVADPVVDGFIKASSTSVTLPCAPVDGDVLISLEVNGTVVARRELFTMVEGSVDVGDYTVAYSSYAVTVSTTKNNDVVRLKVEPVEVYVTDAMKAAVVKVSPPSPAELPPITSSDAGKVLTANNSGVWVAQTPASGGGSGVELVRFNLQTVPGGEPTVGCNHTIEEIDAAREAGKLIIGLYGDPEQMAYVSYSGDDDYPYSVIFYSHDITGDSLAVSKDGFYYEDGAWVYSGSSIYLTGTGE